MKEEEKKLKASHNTAQEAADHPIIPLEAIIEKNPGDAIVAQEARGQTSFVGSDTLPLKMRRDNDKEILEAAGVKFLSPVENDKLFQYVELPAGWKKFPTDHSMWSNLVDDKGRVRATIFYKAAFYDRNAFMSTSTRFEIASDYDKRESEGVSVANVLDGGKVVHTTNPRKIPKERNDKYLAVSKATTKDAENWLTKNYPDWRNPGAYWD